MQSDFISIGGIECQHKDEGFLQSKLSDSSINRNRYCTPSLFTRHHKLTGENSERTWLCYSPSNGHVYCFKCKILLSDMKNNSPFTQGFNHWKNEQRDVELHENSESHIPACLAFAQRRSVIGCVDKEQEKAILNESKYWLSVLRRTVDVVKFLAERG